MADERIDIEIKDSVSSSIATKLQKIGAEARSTHSAIEQLKLSISTLNASPVAQISSALNSNTRAIDRNALSSQRLATEVQRTQAAMARVETELNKAVTAENAAATAAAKLATEQQKTATAAAQAAAAQDRAALAALRLESAQSKASRATSDMEAKAERLKSELYPLWAAQQKYNREVQEALTLYKAGAISVKTYTDAVNQSAERLQNAQVAHNRFNNNLGQTGKQGQLTRHHLVNLGYQINDIGVSLASGQKPLTVFIQQGSQIAGIAASAGVGFGAMAKSIGAMLLKFAPLVLGIGAVVGGLQLLKWSINKDSGLKEFSEGLGLSQREMKKLENVSVTTGDVLKGLWEVIKERFNNFEMFKPFVEGAKQAFKFVWEIYKKYFDTILSAGVAYFNTFKRVWQKLPQAYGEIFTNAVNFAIKPLEFLINKSIGGINKILGVANSLSEKAGFGKIFNEIADVQLPRLTDKFDGTIGSIADIFKEEFNKAQKEGFTSFEKFFDDLKSKSLQAAKDRLKAQADLIINDRIGGQEIDRAEEIAKFNRELDQQIKLLQLLPNLRASESQFYQMTNRLADKKITLTEAENAAFRQKIQLVEEMNRVASEEASLYASTVGARQQFIDQMAAIQNLRNNPASGFTQSDAVASLGNTGVGQFLGDSPEMMQAQIDAYSEYYAQIDALRQQDLISEQTAAAAKMKVWIEQQNLQLQTAKTFFGNLEGLQSSNSKKLARIGKAAAITNAIINTYQAATAAYASLASIPYVGPALGAAAAAAAIGTGLANVQQIRAQSTEGYMRGGYTGNIPRNEVAGQVHGQEFVMNAAATSRIGVANLEALQRGAAQVQQSSSSVGTASPASAPAAAPTQPVPNVINLRVAVVATEEDAKTFLESGEGERVWINIAAKNGEVLKTIVQEAT